MTKDDDHVIVVEFDERRGHFSTEIQRYHVERWEVAPLPIYEAALAAKLDMVEPRFRRHFRYFDALEKVWTSFRNDTSLASLRFVLAQACPELAQARVDFDPDNDQLVRLSLPDQTYLRSWKTAWLEAHVNQAIARQGIDGFVNAAQIRTLYSRAAYYGEVVRSQPVAIRHRADTTGFTGPYNVVADPQRLDVTLYVSDVVALQAPEVRRRLFTEVENGLWKIAGASGASPVCRFLQEELEAAFERAAIGPQRFGLHLPLVLPAGFILREEAQHPCLSDPGTLALLSGGSDYGLLGGRPAQLEMLQRRGLATADAMNPRIKLMPVVALDKASDSTRGRYLALAQQAREVLGSDDRELQALTLPVASQSLGRYVQAIQSFWRSMYEAARTANRCDATVLAWSSWMPLSLPWAARKPRSELMGSRQYDAAAWLSLVVRECVGVGATASTAEAIASCIVPDVSLSAVEKALENLTASGLVTFDKLERRYHQSARNIMTGDDLTNERIEQVHRELSHLLANTLAKTPERCRAWASVLRIPRDTYQDLKTRLRNWLLQLLNESSGESRPEQIALLSAQMFLLSDENLQLHPLLRNET